MEQSTAQTLTRIFAIILWISAAFLLITAGVFTFAFDSVVTAMMNEDEEFAKEITGMGGLPVMQTMMRVIVFLFIVPLAILTVAAGIGVWMKRRWGRVLALICSVLFLFSFPFGTAVGLFGIWLFGFNTESLMLFSTYEPVKKKRATKKR